jgi:hypothetical protein
MPYANYGEKANYERGGLFVRVKEKGEKVTVRLAGKPFYKGQHFMKDPETNKWNIFDCPRIMTEEHCPDCETSFAFYKDAKDKEALGAPKDEVEKLKEKGKQFKATIKWFYPILNRDTGKAAILETGPSVRNKIDAEVAAGTQVMNYDYVLLVTKLPGNDYYAFTRKDSMDADPITDYDKIELEKAKNFDLSDLTGGSKESHQDVEEQETVIEDDPETTEIPAAQEEKVDNEEVSRGLEKMEQDKKKRAAKKKGDGEKADPKDLPFG